MTGGDAPSAAAVEKHATGIPGFDVVAGGGLPGGRTTLVTGTAGSAKTVFAMQFLTQGALAAGEPGIFVTFEESADDLRRNMLSLGWDLAALERDGLLHLLDASPSPEDENTIAGAYDLGALLARLEHAIRRIGARRAAIDSIGALFTQLPDAGTMRRELHRVISMLRRLGVTALLTAERTAEYGDIARHGVEEFVADNVVILRNVLEEEKRRRTLEILKFRGTSHQKGEFPFTIHSGHGVVIVPLSGMELKQSSSDRRISSGSAELDAMCGGGLFRDSIVLVSGATGTGKTLTTMHFLAGGALSGERCLLFAFEESREQLVRNAHGWGIDVPALERAGRLRVVCDYPEVRGLEDHLLVMREAIDAFCPQRVAVDSLSALERVSTRKSYREFMITLTSLLKQLEIASIITTTSPSLMGGTSVTDTHISTLTDSIILLRYVEMLGEIRRAITVLKMRGSVHDKEIREFAIDHQGMHVGKAFRNVTGILSGVPQHVGPDELERLRGMFEEG